MDPKNNAKGYPEDLEYGKFQFVRELATGGAGMVALYKTLPDRNGNLQYPELVAIKFDPDTTTNNLTETLWLKNISKRIEDEHIEINMPKYYMHSFQNSRRFFVMTYLPQTINDLIMSKGPEKKDSMITEVAV